MADEVEVIVTDDESGNDNPETPVVVSAPVVVTEASDDGDADDNTLVALGIAVGNLDARVTALETRNVAQDAAIEEAQISAEVATDIALETATEAAEEDTEEPDNPPVKKHWMHKSFSELFGGSE